MSYVNMNKNSDGEIYEVVIRVDTSTTPNHMAVSRCKDEWFDLALILEGLGVLISAVAKVSSCPNKEIADYVKTYIDAVANDYDDRHHE